MEEKWWQSWAWQGMAELLNVAGRAFHGEQRVSCRD